MTFSRDILPWIALFFLWVAYFNLQVLAAKWAVDWVSRQRWARWLADRLP